MNHTENLSRYIANFVDELVCSGLVHVVISPGSRSTPLAMLFSEHEEIQNHVLIDERSAAYFALGIAKETKRAVALVCTSGTAAANYFPAIVEAYYARVPLIILTADRPHELRDVGASQTINQMNMYGDFVKEFHEMAAPEATPEMLRYIRSRASRAVRVAEEGTPGPVHLNFPFREPLVPNLTLDNLWGDRSNDCFNRSYEGKKQLDEHLLKTLFEKISSLPNGIIVCGPQTDARLARNIAELSNQLQLPILADPLSQLRSGSHDTTNVISTYDAILKSETMRDKLKPDYIIRFGAMPISKSYLFYLQQHEDVLQIVVEDYDKMREPTNHASDYIFADGSLLCQQLGRFVKDYSPEVTWLEKWKMLEGESRVELMKASEKQLTEGETVREIVKSLPKESRLFIANSMPVRDLDTFFMPDDKRIIVHANRGVSGIDGTISSALGVAAVANKPVTLIVGDLSFYHDMNSLFAAKRYNIDLTIVLINNNGGGIFSFLPQAKESKHFEALFGTPLHIDFQKVVDMFSGVYKQIQSKQMLVESLAEAYQKSGLYVLEVQTDRTENAAWHKELWANIEQRLVDNDV